MGSLFNFPADCNVAANLCKCQMIRTTTTGNALQTTYLVRSGPRTPNGRTLILVILQHVVGIVFFVQSLLEIPGVFPHRDEYLILNYHYCSFGSVVNSRQLCEW